MSRLVLVLAACAVALSAPASAQAPLTLVNDSTYVGALAFDVPSLPGIPEADLGLQIATAARPGWLARLRGENGDIGAYLLQPIELAKDAVRLERYYNRNGFPRATAAFDAELDTARNSVAVTFAIEPGPPRVIGVVQFRGPGQADVLDQLVPSLHVGWLDFTESTTLQSGDPH